jgi:hypothetical protein
MIRYQRGRLTIIDREALEATACECYQLDRARFLSLVRSNGASSEAWDISGGGELWTPNEPRSASDAGSS